MLAGDQARARPLRSSVGRNHTDIVIHRSVSALSILNDRNQRTQGLLRVDESGRILASGFCTEWPLGGGIVESESVAFLWV
jgi:hypothetical protein